MSENDSIEETQDNGTPGHDLTGGPGGSGDADSDQKLRDLEAQLEKLRAENQTLRTASNTDSASVFFQGLAKGINQVIDKYKPDTNIKPPAPKKPLTVDTPVLNDHSQVPDSFHDLERQPKTDNIGPPVSQDIANLLAKCWHFPFPKEEIIELLDKQVRPENVLAVKPLQINEEVHLNKQDRKNDKDMRYVGNAICAAGKCLTYLMDMLCKAEMVLRRDFPDDDGWLVWDDFTFDFVKANKLIANAMKILGIANVQTGQARRLLLKPKFSQDVQKICNEEYPFPDAMFFGENLSATAATASDANKVQTKTFHPPTKRGCGRGRGRSNHRRSPYPQQSSVLQAAVLQQALAAAQQQPQVHQQISGLTTGGLFGVNQFPVQPQPPPLLGVNTHLTGRPQRGRGFGNKRRNHRGKSRGR